MFIAALLVVVVNWKQPRCPLIEKWTKKICGIFTQWSTNWPHIKQRVRDLAALSHKWNGCLHQILQFRAQGSLWKRRKKECKSPRECSTQRKQHPLNQQEPYTCELTDTKGAHTGPAKVWTRWGPWVKKRSGGKSHSLAQKQLINTCKRKCSFFQSRLPGDTRNAYVSGPCPLEQMTNPKGTQGHLWIFMCYNVTNFLYHKQLILLLLFFILFTCFLLFHFNWQVFSIYSMASCLVFLWDS